MRYNAYSTKKLFRIAKVIISNIVIFSILFLFIELLLQYIRPYELYKRTGVNEIQNGTFTDPLYTVNWMKIDSSLGWVCKNDTDIFFSNPALLDSVREYTINEHGFRSNFNFDINKVGQKKIMFLGDSFLYGVYLNYQETLIHNLERINDNIIYYNFGMPGYGLDQMYMTFVKYQKMVDPDLTIVVYIDDDIPRMLESYRFVEGLNKPSYELCADSLVLRKETGDNLIIKLVENSYLLNKFYYKFLDYKAVSLAKKILTKIKVDSKKELLLVRWPRFESLYWNKLDWYYDLSNFCKKNNIHYMNLADHFATLDKASFDSLYIPNDGHPSAAGNYLSSKLIYGMIEKILEK